MRRSLEAAVTAAWEGKGGVAAKALSAAALPLEALYRSAVAMRSRAYDRGLLETRRAPVPVVSVGNLAVGGTGKTPLAAWVAALLAGAGHRPALVARGYGEDELLLHRRWNPDVPVHADADRVAAARRAAAAGADCVVLDDGFQHRRLARDLDVVLLAAEHPFPGPLLPRGPWREPPEALRRADVAVLTRRVAAPSRSDALEAAVGLAAPGLPTARVWLAPAGWRDLQGREAAPPEGEVLSVAGVAGPEAFRRMVADATGRAVEGWAFPDHHAYGPGDVDAIRNRAQGRTVVVTEKDAVKLATWSDALPGARVLTLAAVFEAGEARLRELILGVCP